MYILTIYRIIDDIDIELQMASPDKHVLQTALVAWATEFGWEPDSEEASLDEQEQTIHDWLSGGESDDPRFVLRKSDEL